MTRKILIISSKALEDALIHTLRESHWEPQLVQTAQAARKVLDTEKLLVALFILWPEDDERHRTAILELVRSTDDIRWIGGLDYREITNEAHLVLIAEHLHDFVTLPLDADRLAVIAGHAYGMAELKQVYRARQSVPSMGEFDLIGNSHPMQELFTSIRQAGQSDAPVLITGETGTGKERVARAIHAASPRANRPFIPLQCGRITPGNLPPDLQAHPVPFDFRLDQAFSEENEGGTLFLDNVAELAPGAQARLLHLLDRECWHRTEREEEPWKGSRLRILCSTDVDLSLCVQDGLFRCDLFYRLQVLSIRVPSLRERVGDIHMLARHFLDRFQRGRQPRIAGFNKDALAVLSLHDWPGNVRELRNRIQRAVQTCEEEYIAPVHLDLERRQHRQPRMNLQAVREEAERQAVEAAVKRNRLNLSRAAEELGISRITLYRLLEKYELGMNPQ